MRWGCGEGRAPVPGDTCHERCCSGGLGYRAVVGGPEVEIVGDAAPGGITVTMPDARTIHLAMSIAGKPSAGATMSLLPGDRTIRARINRNGEDGGESILHRQ